jgi:peptidoglycan/LPS O-acetylase OafA/YrhL
VARRLVRIIPPYLIASGVACAFGFWNPDTLRRVVFGLVFGKAIGIYYYIPVLVFCTLLVPLLSRLGTRTLIVATVVLAIYAEVAWIDPSWRYTTDFDWGARDPFAQFHLGHFLIGVIAARWLGDLSRWRARAPCFVGALGVAAMVPFIWVASGLPWAAFRPLLHTPYMLGVVTLIASLTPERPAPVAIRFLSDATLAIYLYHFMLHPLLLNWATTVMSPISRIAFMSTASLAASALFVLIVRRCVGPSRSRVLIGA